MNLLKRYSEARPFSDLYMIVAVSLLMISFIVGHFRSCINGLADESKLVFVAILAVRFLTYPSLSLHDDNFVNSDANSIRCMLLVTSLKPTFLSTFICLL